MNDSFGGHSAALTNATAGTGDLSLWVSMTATTMAAITISIVAMVTAQKADAFVERARGGSKSPWEARVLIVATQLTRSRRAVQSMDAKKVMVRAVYEETSTRPGVAPVDFIPVSKVTSPLTMMRSIPWAAMTRRNSPPGKSYATSYWSG